MEQARRTRAHMERILIVSGMPDAGKSTLLRSMFVDPRFQTDGKILTTSRPPLIRLSEQRCLYCRLSSPHEKYESPQTFIQKLDRVMKRAWKDYWRFNFACAMQPNRRGNMPPLTEICIEMIKRFVPERVRIVQIQPRQDEENGTLLNRDEVDVLWKHYVEVITVDGHRSVGKNPTPNGRILADFFDFT